MAFALIAIFLGTLPKTTLAFSTPAATRQIVGSPSPSCRVVLYSRNDYVDDDDFDPFRQSPHSFGETTADADYAGGSVATNAKFGFLSIGEPPEQSSDGAAAGGSAAAVSANDDDSAASAFDPLLSPHAYANGADAGPVVDDDDNASAAVAAATPLDYFDPLLSPHAYANGVDSGPVAEDATHDDVITATAATQKIGILLIDHGSRRAASNAHIHDVAKMYESRLNLRKKNDASTNGGTMMMGGSETITVVRAAHMEITTPSILDSLRDILTVDRVTRVVCVPYFLSPGRHATEDVPELIAEAKATLVEEGLRADILVSNALGTHLESMMGAVDNLVESVLSEREESFF